MGGYREKRGQGEGITREERKSSCRQWLANQPCSSPARGGCGSAGAGTGVAHEGFEQGADLEGAERLENL